MAGVGGEDWAAPWRVAAVLTFRSSLLKTIGGGGDTCRSVGWGRFLW